ncbi:SagB/ThcOx family dehydrogenase [Streptococcus chenjunshii]|uniref:SagB/ThcOx family dehydrogenase n=1 Tax=Streptococcus chenjunshii TaxID=2173853 RepID=A0A372KRA9_9STRE|nr:SagB/ThcOx family dehydrogenase [Streptococcus chenjunshii]AXQ78542.1 SagB/ThcOx family dehydrogenase [Streptococcus chenjunshii]RFU51996.1 SagB/ThcOx family dehydrogenase [Streptococcus chenjunshii]RFU54188.1 SagB/ThcOx family dehydrogenase [Streptococcus chenjunshii]
MTDDISKYYYDNSVGKQYQKENDIYLMREINKFHQKSVFIGPKYNQKKHLNPLLESYLFEIEKKIPKIEIYEESIALDDTVIDNKGSLRHFNADLNFQEVSSVLNHSFGIDKENLHRRFPSAGGLYPVYPIFIQLQNNEYDSRLSRGYYYFDSIQNRLLKLGSLDNQVHGKTVEFALGADEQPMSHQLIVYVGDIEKVVSKYHYVGYKHLFIETGMMAQSLREALSSIPAAGDLSVSGFRHNLLAKHLNLSLSTNLIAMIQWIGKEV